MSTPFGQTTLELSLTVFCHCFCHCYCTTTSTKMKSFEYYQLLRDYISNIKQKNWVSFQNCQWNSFLFNWFYIMCLLVHVNRSHLFKVKVQVIWCETGTCINGKWGKEWGCKMSLRSGWLSRRRTTTWTSKVSWRDCWSLGVKVLNNWTLFASQFETFFYLIWFDLLIGTVCSFKH